MGAKEGKQDIVIDEVTGSGVKNVDVELAGDGRVIAASLARQAGGNDAETIDGNDEQDGANPAEVVPFVHCSSPL